MNTQVKLSAIVEAMDMQFEDAKSYFDKETGAIIAPTPEEFEAAEDIEPLENYPGWQREAIQQARDILESATKYVVLPDRFDRDEYHIMENFCLSRPDRELSETLLRTIKGSGAFRRFKDALRNYGIAEDWYAYRADAFKEIARDWCESNDIPYKD